MKSVYIESSVISYITARPSRDVVTSARQAISIEWWDIYKNSFEIFVSELVLEEISFGDLQAASNRLAIVEGIPVLVVTTNAVALAKSLIAENAIPASSMEDATKLIPFLMPVWRFISTD